MKDTVLFDMDGVLVDTEPLIQKAAILGLREYGADPVPEDFVPFIGTGEDRFIGGVAEKYGLVYIPEMKKRVYDIYDRIVSIKIACPGVHELIRHLDSKGYIMAVVSSADRRKITSNLTAADIREDYFSVVISGEDVSRRKPFPDIFLLAAGRLGKKPSECMVIEDAVNGIQAAKAAGIYVVAVTSSFSKEKLALEEPDLICADLFELKRFFEQNIKIY